RGWARYPGQLGLQSTPQVKETLDSVSLRGSQHALGEACYWGDESVDCIEFVKSVLNRLDKEGWPNKCDLGCSEYDLEVLGSRWTRLRLPTVPEDYPRKKKMI